MSKKYRRDTIAIRSTMMVDANAGSVNPPIYPSTTFERESDGSYPYGYIYSRLDNPNRSLLEQSLATLEMGKASLAFSSGMAATSAVLQTLSHGAHIVIQDDAYYSTYQLASEVFEKLGIAISLVDTANRELVREKIRPKTKLIWLETPSNPLLKVCDISAIAEIASEHDLLLVVDNTWGTPVIQNPLSLGADVVMHSTTKYIGGHGDVTGGALILKHQNNLFDQLKRVQQLSGAVPSPFDCWLLTRGIKTLHLRVRQQSKNARELALFLEKHPKIDRVHYPGLQSHAQHEIATNQMNDYGAMLSVEVKGSSDNAMALTGKLKLFTTATSLGGVESLVEHRKSVEGDSSQTPGNLLRVSVGLEHPDDLMEDWDQALTST